MKCSPCGILSTEKINVLIIEKRGTKLVEKFYDPIQLEEFSWCNPDNNFDVDGDGVVTPLDAILILEALRNGIVYNKNIKPDYFYDVNCDGKIDESDALAVLDHIIEQNSLDRPEPIEYDWTNLDNNFDVDGDGIVTPLDALLILTALRNGIVYNKYVKPNHFYDVNGDGKVDESDALAVLNHLGSRSRPNPMKHIWTNPKNNFDVDGDGVVTPLDALLILTAIRNGVVYNENVKPDHFYDVNGDKKIDQSDALAVLNHIRSQNDVGIQNAIKTQNTDDPFPDDPYDFVERCEFENVRARLKYVTLPQNPINVYSTYAKYVVRDFIDRDIKGTVIVPIDQWTNLNIGWFDKTPCSYWISNTMPVQYIQYDAMESDDIVEVSDVSEFISPVMGIGGGPLETASRVPLHDEDDVPGRIVFGDQRCTKTKSQLGYRKCVVESIELMILMAKDSGLVALPPFTEKEFDIEIIYFDPGNCINLDMIFAIDISGSMGPTINNIKDGIDEIIDFISNVSDESTIGIVTYGGSSGGDPKVILQQTGVDTEQNRNKIRQAVSSINVVGAIEPHGKATNLSIDQLVPLIGPFRSQLIILITDEPSGAGGEPYSSLIAAANRSKDNNIPIFGVQVGSHNPLYIYDFLIEMAQISGGAAVKQSDGIIVDPLIKLLSRYCLSSKSTSVLEVQNPNECDLSSNENDLEITIEIERKQTPGDIHSFNTSININDIYDATGNPFYWNYNIPPNGLVYETKPVGVGNWLNYTMVARQGVSMDKARWDGFKLITDSTDGTGVIQCTPDNIKIINGFGRISIPLISYSSSGFAKIYRCLPQVFINTTNDSISTRQSIKIENATGGYYYFRNKITCELSDKVWWDSNNKDIKTALESMNGIGLGNAIVTGTYSEYTIQYATSLGVIPGIEIISYPYLTCTDQEITVVDDPPYNYLKPKPKTSIADPIGSCEYCSYESELFEIKMNGLNYNCVKNLRSLVCRVSSTNYQYTKYKYQNNVVIEIDESHILSPGDVIVLIDRQLKDHRKYGDRISRNFDTQVL